MLKNIEILNDKIDTLIKVHQELRQDNESLKNQLVAAQGQNEILNNKIRDLESSQSGQDSEIDTLLDKLNNIA